MNKVIKKCESEENSSKDNKVFLHAIYQNMLNNNSRLLAKWNLDKNHDVKDNFLCTAVRIDDFETTKILLENGADTEFTDLFGLTPLACAIFEGHNKIVKIICRQMAKKSIKPKDALQWAVAIENIHRCNENIAEEMAINYKSKGFENGNSSA